MCRLMLQWAIRRHPSVREDGASAYAASKAAFHRFAPILALELEGTGIRIHNVDPGYVETERQKINAAASDSKAGTPALHRLCRLV